jgi:hypothetical protein
MKTILQFICPLLIFGACAQKQPQPKTIVDIPVFETPLDADLWCVEMDSLPHSSVTVSNGKLITDTKGGVTVWLNKPLEGNIEITFKRKVVVADGINDRLSDMNLFWMASDPNNSNLFTRRGKFAEYDSLLLYYVGMGGNTNTTTRFRRYNGNGEKPLLFENNNTDYLLKANHEYAIKVVVNNGTTTYWVDGECIFEYHDPNPITVGYFGFRSTWSRHEIRNFKVVQLP